MTLGTVLRTIKAQLQDDQALIFKTLGNDSEEAGRIAFRAELDALWGCVEVIAQVIDKREDVVIPDHFRDRRRRL